MNGKDINLEKGLVCSIAVIGSELITDNIISELKLVKDDDIKSALLIGSKGYAISFHTLYKYCEKELTKSEIKLLEKTIKKIEDI